MDTIDETADKLSKLLEPEMRDLAMEVVVAIAAYLSRAPEDALARDCVGPLLVVAANIARGGEVELH